LVVVPRAASSDSVCTNCCCSHNPNLCKQCSRGLATLATVSNQTYPIQYRCSLLSLHYLYNSCREERLFPFNTSKMYVKSRKTEESIRGACALGLQY
jgi:hypothetical protein